MIKNLCLAMILIVCLTACQAPTAVPTPDLFSDSTQPYDPDTWSEGFKSEITWGDCPFDTYDSNPACGTLDVPLDYSQPTSGKTTRLALARYPASGESPKSDPVLILFGYPRTAMGFVPYVFDDLNEEHDLIIFDQRGTGLSTPSLVCPEMNTSAWDALTLGWPTAEDWAKFNRQCRQTLETGQQINLDDYSLDNMANDVKALRLALGVMQWNLIGEDSIGGLVAYEQLRVDSEGVRSIILDTPPNNGDPRPRYQSAAKVLSEFFALCGQDTKCNEAFPDLEKTFANDIELLNANPMKVTAYGAGGRQGEFLINGNFLLDMVLFNLIYPDRTMTGQIPRMFYQIKDGNPEVLGELTSWYINSADFSYDHVFSMTYCRQFPLFSENELSAAASAFSPYLAEHFEASNQNDRAVCEVWAPLPSQGRLLPNPGSKPILILTGSWDWFWSAEGTISAFAQAAPNAQIVSFPGSGRYSFFYPATSDCALKIGKAFISSPEARADTTCLPKEQKITWITMR